MNVKFTAVSAVILACSAFIPNTAMSMGFLKSAGIDDNAVAESYYRTIDPNNERLTQADWEEVNGYNDPSNEVVVVKGHFTDGDLAFFRSISMVEDKRPGHEGNIAYTTANYLTEADALAESNAVSIVNMEYSTGPEGDDKITKFYVYDAATGQRLNSTSFDANNEQLYLPAACFACHGGDDDAEAPLADGYNEGSGETNSTFLAFDMNTMIFSNNVTRASLEAGMKKLNEGVMKTDPSKATRKLIKGLYGGPGLPRATQDLDYIPSSWKGEQVLYHDVIVPTCRTCHTTSDSKVLSLSWWKDNAADIREVIFSEQFMPDSMPSFNRFWDTNQNQIVLDALNRFEAN